MQQDGTRLPALLPETPQAAARDHQVTPVKKASSGLVSPWVEAGRGHGARQTLGKRNDGGAKPCDPPSICNQPAPRQENPEHLNIKLKRAARRRLQPRGDQAGKSPHRGQASGRGAPAAKLLPKALRYQLQTIILPWQLTLAPHPGASWPDGARPPPAGGDLITLLICQTARHAAPAEPEPAGTFGSPRGQPGPGRRRRREAEHLWRIAM